MFEALTLHGDRASLVWGYRPVAVLTAWRIVKAPDAWVLTATVDGVHAWQVQQAAKHDELLFTAPRDKGRSCWAVRQVSVGGRELRATLGPPLQ